MNKTKEKILLAASRLFLAGGISALSVRAIARESKLSTIGIYKYFKGKQGILDALYIEGFEHFLAALDVPIDESDIKGNIIAATKGYIRTAFKYQGHYRLIFGESVADYVPSEEAKQKSVEVFIHTTKIIGGLLPADSTYGQRQKTALQVWSIVHGYIGLQQHAIADEIDSSLWEGMILETVSLHVDALMKLHQSD